MKAMRFDAKLARLCEAKGWTQADLARAVGVSKNTANRWFNGLVRPYDRALVEMARSFGVPVDFLTDDGADEPPAGLSDAQRRVLWLAELVGYEEAARRLAAAPATAGDAGDGEARDITDQVTIRETMPGRAPAGRRKGAG